MLRRGALPGPGRERDREHRGEIELFGFGGLCVMVEGRCLLSSYACGDSPNTFGLLARPCVRWQQTAQGMETRLNGS
nr:U32 family peptidase [Parasulfuritortus cantonensis]